MPKKTRLAHQGGLLSVVRCLLITTKTRPRKPPLALAGVGTREERAHDRAKEGEGGGGEGGRFAYVISFVGGRHQAFRPFHASHITVVLIPYMWWTRASTSSFGITICSCLSSLIFLRLLLLRGELSDRCLDRRAIGCATSVLLLACVIRQVREAQRELSKVAA